MAARQDFFAWRLIATAISFALFGLGGLLLGGVLFPLSRLIPMPTVSRRNLGSRLVAVCFHAFVEFMRSIGGLTYEFRGHERLGRPGQLILANHPSLIDVVFLIGFTPRACCVVKAALWRNPFMAGVVTGAGYIPSAPTDVMIERSAQALAAGQSLIMFPEGTRTTPGAPVEFHRGAAVVALRAARVITPVFISVAPTTLTKHEPWYRIPWRRPHFELVVGDDIDPGPFRALGPLPRAGRSLNGWLINHFRARQPV
jgi:1-acyl-sn-glycerol-3-phosphate acyltransferase